MAKSELANLLKTAKMELGKWASNSIELLSDNDHSEAIQVNLDKFVSTLGIRWHPWSDSFFFEVSLPPPNAKCTKQVILSKTARLFDPFVWIPPIIIVAKILIQDLSLRKECWDTDWREQTETEYWDTIQNSLTNLKNIKILRWTGITAEQAWELHIFSDASKRAYASEVYAVVTYNRPTLLMSKTKVAPTLDLPQLELCGEFILSRLTTHLVNSLENKPSKIRLWCYSKVVLNWL